MNLPKISKANLLMLLALVVGVIIIVTLLNSNPIPYKKTHYSQVQINNATVSVDIADTDSKRSTGLMNVATLAKNTGMLFIFDDSKKHSFWMANTKISLDIIWIDEKYKVVSIRESVPPCAEELIIKCPIYTPESAGKYVLETNAGWVSEHNIQIGNTVNIL